MGGWVGMYLLFIYLLHFYYLKFGLYFNLFFWLLNFLFDLTSQKNHLMVSWRWSNQHDQYDQVIKCDQMSK
jgi:hypothetical protein